MSTDEIDSSSLASSPPRPTFSSPACFLRRPACVLPAAAGAPPPRPTLLFLFFLLRPAGSSGRIRAMATPRPASPNRRHRCLASPSPAGGSFSVPWAPLPPRCRILLSAPVSRHRLLLSLPDGASSPAPPTPRRHLQATPLAPFRVLDGASSGFSLRQIRSTAAMPPARSTGSTCPLQVNFRMKGPLTRGAGNGAQPW